MSPTPLSEHFARYKFEATTSWPVPDTARIWYGAVEDCPRVFPQSFLIEACLYDDGAMHVYLLNRPGTDVRLPLNSLAPQTAIIGRVGFCFICNTLEPYVSMLEEAERHYRGLNLPFDVAVCTHRTAGERLDMAPARNRSLEMADGCDHVFMLDVDTRLPTSAVMDVIDRYRSVPNHGVLNLKTDSYHGNGLYFGRHDLMLANGYDERFKRFWFEDTEFLMNFSRIGILPLIAMLDFEIKDHPRDQTLRYSGTNDDLFVRIANFGREGADSAEARAFAKRMLERKESLRSAQEAAATASAAARAAAS